MIDAIKRRDVANQFIVAIELLLEWIEQNYGSIEQPPNYNNEVGSLETQLL
jgi:hypothetical protein